MLRTTVVLWALMACGAAYAQVSGRVALVSDYRYRGVSLSDRRPAAQVGLDWDGARGGYAGALLSSARIATGGDLHAVSYLGIARRMRAGPSWEAGAQFVFHGNQRGDHYRELYLGLASERLGARLYLRPAAFGPQGHAAYLELNAWHPLGERVQLFAHAGQGWQAEGMTRTYSDLRVGVGIALGDYRLQLSAVDGDARGDTDTVRDARRPGWVVGISRDW